MSKTITTAKRREQIAGFLTKHVSVDYVVLVAVGLAVYCKWTTHNIDDLDIAGRRAIYQTAAAISTAMFGLTMTSLSILISNADKPYAGLSQGLPTSTRNSIAGTMFALLRSLGVFLGVAFALLVADTATGPWTEAHALIVALGAVVAVRVTRVTYVLSNMIPAFKAKTPA